MFKNLTTVTQGTVGLAACIEHLAKQAYTVLLPLNDNQNFDLAFADDTKIYTVQVKTTRAKPTPGGYSVQLKQTRSNKTKNVLKMFDPNSTDFVFVLCEDGTRYMIPSKEVKVTCSLVLNRAYDKFKV